MVVRSREIIYSQGTAERGETFRRDLLTVVSQDFRWDTVLKDSMLEEDASDGVGCYAACWYGFCLICIPVRDENHKLAA